MLFLQQMLNGLVLGSVYALFSLGFTLVFGVQRILNLAHGAVFMVGAFVGLVAVTQLHIAFLPALVVAALAGGVVSVLVDLVAFRPLRNRRGSEFSALISSIGIALVISNVAQILSQSRVWRYPFGTFPIKVFVVSGLRITLLQLTILGSVAVIVLVLALLLFRTSLGRQLRAVAISPHTALLLGCNVSTVYLTTFFISGVLAGIAGVLIGLAFNSVSFLMGDPYMVRAFVVVVLGGLGSVWGAVLAGLLLGLVQTLTVAFVSSNLSDAIVFGLLFLALLVRPGGLFGTARHEGRVARA